MKPARTRFAVSPTGFMHVGGVRNALFDWLVARQTGGQFVLRIEDTDQAREVPGAVGHIMETLHWLGLDWNEGPVTGGPAEPYIQSQRLDIYKAWAQKLVDAGKAYADPYTTEEVQAFREAAQAAKKPFLFRDHRPENPPTWDGTQPLRLKSEPKAYTWHDEVMGEMHAGAEAVEDFVLMKSDGFPTYNFCHIVDDELMNITHIIRSQEFVASMPRYLNLYDALGIAWPTFAHLPWIMGPDGKKKLSKRDGAKDVMDYRREGYLPETILNFLASLGWNDGTEQEVFSVAELVEKFSLTRIQKGGAKFDEQRLLWMNGAHIRNLTPDELYERSKDFWPESAQSASDDYKKQVLGLIQERLKYFAEILSLTSFFFEDLPVDMELIDGNKQLKKFEHSELKALLEQAKTSLEASDFSANDLTERLNALLEETGQKPGVLFSLIRIASTQAPSSPSLAETLNVLGKETSLKRIEQTLSSL
jgi:glutamyl-tRNA synthetase